MKQKSILLFVAALAFLFPGTCRAQVNVYDNSNQYLGQLLSAQNLELYNPTNGKLFIIDPVTKNLYERTLYFKTSNCTGQGYATVSPNEYVFMNSSNLYITSYETEYFAPTSTKTNSTCNSYSAPFSFNYAKVNPYTESWPFSRPIQMPIHLTTQPPSGNTKVVVVPLSGNN